MEKARNTDAFRSVSPGASVRAVELDCVAVAEVELGTFAEGSKRATPAESSRSGRRLSPSTSTNAIPLCCRECQRLDNIQSFVRAHHKMPLYMTVKKPSTWIVRHVTKLESISTRPVLARLNAHRMTAQPEGGSSTVSRYGGSSRLTKELGTSWTDE